ncbi:MAG: glycosyltransferase [Bacteroidales bacterium]|nr:glycosyltransferase [Lentimicrobiaceae bacterium]MDD5695471.1 glycosyltransferase [Bacteroidales bacterium]
MIILAVIAWVFLLLRLVVVLSNLLGKQWLKDLSMDVFPSVSILIPARNEENAIGKLLHSISEQDYPVDEVIVYDDDSVDATSDIVRDHMQQDTRFRLIRGESLPEGWLGKNHACHQLARNSRGDYLLFLDADVEIGPGLIKNSLAYLTRKNLKLFSIFPQQIMLTWGERITVPVMNYILLTLLPLSLIKNSRRASLSAANGQFMLFDGAVYRNQWFHQQLKDQVVEDIRIMRYMKNKGFRVHTLLSSGQIRCRMYHGFNEAIRGFSRNVTDYFGGNILAMLLFTLFSVFGFVFVLLGLPIGYFVAYLLVNILLSVFVSLLSRQPVLMNLLLLPLQKVTFIMMGTKAILNRITGTSYWKGRRLK